MRLTVSQMNPLMTPTSAAISTANHQWKRHASCRPKATPMGVVISNNGLAIRICLLCSIQSGVARRGRQELWRLRRMGGLLEGIGQLQQSGFAPWLANERQAERQAVAERHG